MAHCSGEDHATFNRELECMEALPVCRRETMSEWSAAFVSCQTKPEELSEACRPHVDPIEP
jgi:hypothetical protein